MEEGPSRISTSVTSAEQLAQVLATGIPFTQTPYLEWLRAKCWTAEPGDEQRILLEHTGSWTAAQDLAIERLQRTGVINGLSRIGPNPFPLTAKLALIRAETAARQAEQPPAPARLVIEHPRFVVEERLPAGYAVVDTTKKLRLEVFGLTELEDERNVSRRLRGQCTHFTGIQETHCRAGIAYASVEQAHLTFPCHKDSGLQICARCQFPTKETLPALVTAYQETALRLRQEHAQKVAEEWAYTWNLVELGYCGNCHRRIADIPGYQPGPDGEPPMHTHTFGHRMYRRLCFDCSCSLED